VLKKAGFVAATAVGLCLIGGTAANASTTQGADSPGSDKTYVTFADAYHQFIEGGGAAGYGAASLVAGAYTGIMETPQNIADNFLNSGH
jgi:hypothetical protein